MKTGMQVSIEHFDNDERTGHALLIAQAWFAIAAEVSPGGAALSRPLGV